MRKYYPAFVWKYSEKTRLELNPGAESFIIAPERKEFVSIKESDTVSYLVMYICLSTCTFYYLRFLRMMCVTETTVMTLISTLLEFFSREEEISPAAQ